MLKRLAADEPMVFLPLLLVWLRDPMYFNVPSRWAFVLLAVSSALLNLQTLSRAALPRTACAVGAELHNCSAATADAAAATRPACNVVSAPSPCGGVPLAAPLCGPPLCGPPLWGPEGVQPLQQHSDKRWLNSRSMTERFAQTRPVSVVDVPLRNRRCG